MNWKKLLICCVSFVTAFFANVAIDLACGGEEDPYDYYISFYHNNLQGEKGYGSFYFTNYQYLYSDVEPASETDINASEWVTYLGKSVKPADVKKAMYGLDSAKNEAVNQFLGGKRSMPDSLAQNTFLSALVSDQKNGALQYYRFAKAVEPIANFSYNLWEPTPVDTVSLRNAATKALNYASAEKDAFLKLRYAYQAERLFHYGKEYQKAKDIYDRYINKNPSKSHVKGWALALKAGEERRLGDTLQAAYLFSKVFANYPERRVQAYRNYHYINVTALQVLPLAKTDAEKAVIYAIDGFGNPEITMDYLEKVYQYEPTSPMVGVLLVREVNKLEEYYLTGKLNNLTTSAAKKLVKPIMLAAKNGIANPAFFTAVPDSVLAKYNNHIQKLVKFCDRLSAEKKYPEIGIANITKAYLWWMQNKTDDGFAAIAASEKEDLGPKLKDQQQIVKLLLSAQKIKQVESVNENTLLPSLKWLDTKVESTLTETINKSEWLVTRINRFASTSRNFYLHVLVPSYLRQGDTTQAALAILKSESYDAFLTDYPYVKEKPMPDFWYNYLRSKQLQQIITWKKNQPKTPWLQFLTARLANVNNENLYELLGTVYLREHNYAAAVTAFAHQKNKGKRSIDNEEGNPFLDQLNDYPKTFSAPGKGFTKADFAKAMASLQNKIKAEPKNPQYVYRFATGLYNTSTYGNSWNLISYNWSSMDFARKPIYSYDADYVQTSNAEKYYLRARNLSKDANFKAKCTFMAAKCQQKQQELPSFEYSYEVYQKAQTNYRQQMRHNPYFKDLRAYRHTAFYKTAVADCSYLRDFIAGK